MSASLRSPLFLPYCSLSFPTALLLFPARSLPPVQSISAVRLLLFAVRCLLCCPLSAVCSPLSALRFPLPSPQPLLLHIAVISFLVMLVRHSQLMMVVVLHRCRTHSGIAVPVYKALATPFRICPAGRIRRGSNISARGGRQGIDDNMWDGDERFLTYANTDLQLFNIFIAILCLNGVEQPFKEHQCPFFLPLR